MKQIFVFRPLVTTSVVLAYLVGFRAAPAVAAEDPLNPPRLAELGLPAEGLAKLIGDGQLVLLHPGREATIGGKNREVRFASAAVRIGAPVSTVAAVVYDFASYPEFMPQTEKVSVTKAPDGADRVAFRLRFELPVGGIRLDYTLDHRATPDGGIAWTLVEGDMAANVGRWEFFAAGPNDTVAVYTLWSDLRSTSFILRQILDAQPDLDLAIPVSSAWAVAEAVRRRAEGRAPMPPVDVKGLRPEPVIPLYSRGELPEDVLRSLAARGTVLFIHPTQWLATASGPLDLVFVTAMRPVPVDLPEARRLARSFDRYPEFFDQVRSAKVTPTPKGLTVDWHLGIGFGILAIPLKYRLEYVDVGPATMPFRRVSGDLDYVWGAWEWLADGDDRTLAIYTTGSRLGDKAPAVLKLGNLIPNRQVVVGVSSAALIVEKQAIWIAQQSGR